MNRIFLIDGHAQIFRMYYAFMRHPMVNSREVDTSIIFGFTKMVLELMEREKPTHIAVAFDPPAKTFRHEIYPQYKANRGAAPEPVKEALEPLTELMGALNIPVVMVPGYEADDVIGSMASQWAGPEDNIYMVTPDKDYGQLISDNIFQYKPSKGGGDVEIIGREQLCTAYGISDPRQVIDILTIWGDASDNVPGVRGIGEVGAKKLISKYGSVEGLLSNISQLSPKQQEAVKEAGSRIEMSKFLVTIKRDIPLPLCKEQIRLHEINKESVDTLFNEYEINSLRKFLEMEPLKSEGPAPQKRAALRRREVAIAEFAEAAGKYGSISMKFTSEESLIMATGEEPYLHCHLRGLKGLPYEEFSTLKELLSERKIIKRGAGFKQYIKYLRSCSIDLNGALETGLLEGVMDVEIMHYLLDPEKSHNISMLIKGLLGEEPAGPENPNREQKNATDLFSAASGVEQEQRSSGDLNETLLLLPLCRELERRLEQNNLAQLYYTIEMPLIAVLGDMEWEGVKIDTLHLKNYSMVLGKELEEIERQVRELSGEPELNILSPKQIGVLLYEKLKLDPKIRKNARGSYPTDEEKLGELKGKHPIVEKILEYRGVRKLLSTYIDSFPQMIDDKGRLHTTFNQALTATGRLSSSNPNLQNIPIRTERGREIRKAFIPSQKEGVIVSADYSQIELRLMAHISGDRGLIEAFNHGRDIHTATAARIFKEREEEVTKEQRSRAKSANFGIIYGISTYGLSQRMGMSRTDSRALIDEYYNSYPGVKEYINRIIESAKEKGYVETIYGRRRYLPDINSRNSIVRGYNERNAINSPLQGSAADIIKLAMINVYKRLRKEKLKSRMVLQVHDELVLDVWPGEKEQIIRLLKEEMEGIVRLDVPLVAECNAGKNWLEAH